jgi:hypothetical protein
MSGEERRRFERVNLPVSSNVEVRTDDNHALGAVRMLGRGGLQVQSSRKFSIGEEHRLLLIDESEEIRREVNAIVRNVAGSGLVGFEFQNLSPDAAVEIGVIIGKYYSAGQAAAN